jgi:predicted HicB family RNase H-like nuclease
MSEHKPPHVTTDTPIGADVDLDRDDVRLADGTRLTDDVADQITEQVRRGGRPSLSGEQQVSPQITFRVPREVRDRAAEIATRPHKSLSQLAREALEKLIRAS